MQKIIRLFYDLSVYRSVIFEKSGTIFLRLVLAYLVLALGYSLHFYQTTAQSLKTESNTALASIVQSMPENATITLQNGQLNTQNLPLPYVVPPLLTLDAQADIKALASASTAIALSNSQIRMETDNNTYQILTYQEAGFSDFSLTGEQLIDGLNNLQTILNQIFPYLPLILAPFVTLGLLIARTLHALFYSMIFQLISTFSRSQYRLKHFFKLALHSIIVADAINLLVLFLYGPGYSVVFTLAFIGISILAYINLPAIPHITKNPPSASSK